ncbi:MAG: bifunctional phosphopantothenoylcysteine decarboxylase/phosphopantothenate--cysteine ligase CoaBC [Pseudomonadota bacterium]
MVGSPLLDKRILLIVGGGIAAYKSLELIRRLREQGALVRVLLTRAGSEFVTKLSFSALTEDKVYSDLFDLTDEAEMGHIQLSRDADLLVVAPATADLIAKMATGRADDLAATTLLATDKPVLVAPAMNVRMWLHQATQRNVRQIMDDGVSIIGPNEGSMACNEYGPGRMAEPPEILDAIANRLSANSSALAGRHVVVTSGPTHEPIDPVRYIANRSSGKQGHAIAEALRDAGARVTLISGPVALADPSGVPIVKVQTASDMLAAVRNALPADALVMAAAVADWRVADRRAQKTKKTEGSGPEPIVLTENPDILATIGKSETNRPSLVIGFAAETENLIANARSKLDRKGADWIVANDVSPEGGVFGGDENTVRILRRSGVEVLETMTKRAVAQALVDRIVEALEKGPAGRSHE